MEVGPAATPRRSTLASGLCCQRRSRPKARPWAVLSPPSASKEVAVVGRGRVPSVSHLAPFRRSHHWWCHPSCWTATQRWATPSPPTDSTRLTTLLPSCRVQNWAPTAPCRAAWPSRTPLSTPPPSGPRTPDLSSFRCPQLSPCCLPHSPRSVCPLRTGAPSATPPSAWPQTWFTTCDPTTKRSTPWSLWSSGGARRSSSAPYATSPSGNGITCHVTWPPITDFLKLTRTRLLFNMDGLSTCLDLSTPTGNRPLKNTRTPLALTFTLDYNLWIPFLSVCFYSPVKTINVLGVCKCVLTSKMNLFMKSSLKSLRIREDLNMCNCTVSCILYHINANIEKNDKCSHTSWFTTQQVFSCLQRIWTQIGDIMSDYISECMWY